MRIVKALFVLLLLSIIVIGLFSTDNTKENAKRESIAVEIQAAIEAYYQKNQHYPKNLDFYQKSGVQSYIDEGVIRYTLIHQEGKSSYQLIWVFAGSLKKRVVYIESHGVESNTPTINPHLI